MDIVLFASDGVPADQIANVLGLEERIVVRLVFMYSPIALFARSISQEAQRRSYIAGVISAEA
jgi:hypothetical protein